MATSSPFSFLEVIANTLVQRVSSFEPPDWAVEEVQHRLILLLNHVLMQEPEATNRLVRLKGRVVRVQWSTMTMSVTLTPAGLLERSSINAKADLSLIVAEESLLSILQTGLDGGKPDIKIEGDVQLAAEMNWLVDHVRWDIEEDVSRVLGDAPAHALANLAKQIASGLKSFLVTKVQDEATISVTTGKAVT